jgi:exopolysaccharide biosynthesis protein
MVDNRLLSESQHNRVALFIRNRATPFDVSIAYLEINQQFKIKGKMFYFAGINRERKDNESILYTREFHRTTLTDTSGSEIVIRDGKVAAINNGAGSSVIPENGYTISLSGKARDGVLALARIGMKVKLYTGTPFGLENGSFPNKNSDRTTRAFAGAEDIVGGVPQLIRDGKIDITWEKEKSSKSFVETRHPRTAVAKLKDGKFLMITIDGRSEESGGIGLQDLAEYLLSLGAVDAMNLDGGGSTTMFLDGKVVNHPSDKEGERKVSDALIVRKR